MKLKIEINHFFLLSQILTVIRRLVVVQNNTIQNSNCFSSKQNNVFRGLFWGFKKLDITIILSIIISAQMNLEYREIHSRNCAEKLSNLEKTQSITLEKRTFRRERTVSNIIFCYYFISKFLFIRIILQLNFQLNRSDQLFLQLNTSAGHGKSAEIQSGLSNSDQKLSRYISRGIASGRPVYKGPKEGLFRLSGANRKVYLSSSEDKKFIVF